MESNLWELWRLFLGISVFVLIALFQVLLHLQGKRHLREIKDLMPSCTMTIHPDGRVTTTPWRVGQGVGETT